MNSIKYYRCKKHMTVSDLSRESGVASTTISRLEKKPEMTTSLVIYDRIACALGVTVDDLLIECDGDTLQENDHPTFSRRSARIANCIEAYRRKENLTFQQLADRLGGFSRQRAQKVCASEHPNRRFLELLARHEGISCEEFESRYAVKEGECAG